MSVHPALAVVDRLEDGLLVAVRQLARQLLLVDGVAQAVDVVLQVVLGLHTLLSLAVLLAELLGLGDHLQTGEHRAKQYGRLGLQSSQRYPYPLDLVLAQAAHVIGDGDPVRVARALLDGSHVQDTVRIKIESDLESHQRDT